LEERKGSCERKVLAKVVRELIDGIVCEAVAVIGRVYGIGCLSVVLLAKTRVLKLMKLEREREREIGYMEGR
jgi:hypothetical protein